MAELVLENVSKVYPGGLLAVDELNLDLADGEFMVTVGPSGCGKTTALRMVAGLEDVTSGRIDLDGKLLNDVEPRDRDVAMVFQNYALYPHMTVRNNLAFPLREHGVRKDERDKRVQAVAETLGLGRELEKRPGELSGGQRQRVAMGRAIIREPRLFLMDEPLSNLDAKLRVQLRTEIHAIQRRFGVTTMYVTHDQVEAMTLGDRVAVMREGVLQQVGAPGDVYERPGNLFVASFLGNPGMNLLDASLVSDEAGLSVRIGDAVLPLDEAELRQQPGLHERAGSQVVVGVRPESLSIATGEADRRVPATVTVTEGLGSSVLAYFTMSGVRDTVSLGAATESGNGASSSSTMRQAWAVGRLPPGSEFDDRERVELTVGGGAMRFFDPGTGKAM